ncbi:unnamed protein product [Mesocestoides corti]|uniref:D-aminoacyl-tRNA deacylase n=1 Tax=Mesocestoides corti TaxID=53468 RepID=A0A0R3U377_MESCO|nr:unnamed protein product [Mesocestoides corti]
MVLVGISRDDDEKDAAYMARKIVNLRIFEDAEKHSRWGKSVKDVGGEILCVSQPRFNRFFLSELRRVCACTSVDLVRPNWDAQFTLHSLLKGNKLDFHLAMAPDASKTLYEAFLVKVRKEYQDADKVKDGIFGAMMDVSLVNDGPVTVTLDSRQPCPPPPPQKTVENSLTPSGEAS